MFVGSPVKYKNHLYEYCQAKKWPEDKFPVFTEDQEAQGNKFIIHPININCMIVFRNKSNMYLFRHTGQVDDILSFRLDSTVNHVAHILFTGYRGKVMVNGQSFTCKRVFNDKKAAHQEVAYIALEQLKLQEESTDEPSSSVMHSEASSSTSSGEIWLCTFVNINCSIELWRTEICIIQYVF